jgi:hypothetical protein
MERVKNLYQSDCSNERRKKLQKVNTGKSVAPEKLNSNMRSTEMRSQQSRIMRSCDMNRLRCPHANRLIVVHGVVMSRVIIITFQARRNANVNGKDLVTLMLQLAYMYQRGLLVMDHWTCSFQHA